jgi:hypothetical protein
LASGAIMAILRFVTSLASNRLDLTFTPSRDYSVSIVERPGEWMQTAKLDALISDCRDIVGRCLNGQQLDYGLFDPSGVAWRRSVVTLVRKRETGQAVAFNAMPLLDVVRAGRDEHVLHLGLVMVDPSERSGGLSWILYGLTCFALFLRGGLAPLWITSVTQVPAVVGMVAELFDNVYPAQKGTPQSFAHRHIAHQIMAAERTAFGVGDDADFDPDRQIIMNAYTGGSDNLKKTYDAAAKHRDETYNTFCQGQLDYDRGDDVLQIGMIDIASGKKYLTKSVPRAAIAQLSVQAGIILAGSIIGPLLRWFDASKPMGRLRSVR